MLVGEVVQAEFVEQVNSQVFIVNFNGKLIRVKNSTQIKFKALDKIHLKVASVSPLSFRLHKSLK